MGGPEVEIIPYGARAILLNWPQKIDENTLFQVLNAKKLLSDYYIKQKVYINSAYNSILINYISTINNIYDEILTISELILANNPSESNTFNSLEIPVCYEEKFGIDLQRISDRNNLSVKEIIQLHSSAYYRVYFIGFLPGFLYLGGLDKKLSCPRLETPRQSIPAGSVAIGGDQTGIYPKSSPGGWNIIGRSPVPLFDIKNNPPTVARAGDLIRFVPIDHQQFLDIDARIKAGEYKLQIKPGND
ncbi:MAG: 5-oxoprolinase subunit PxpB [Bacteroidia bacterium]|nr:5-oxoprolinase subunit PxpB [Bacteroidia bacterium]